MIRDAKGRKWMMRFRHYANGWTWEAWHENRGQELDRTFKTKALAEAHARKAITEYDSIAAGQEYWRRLMKRGTDCQLTAADRKAIERAGKVVRR